MASDEQRSDHQHLQERTRQSLLQLIESEFKVAHTMTQLAETEAKWGDEPHARALLEKVEQAIGTVRRYTADKRVTENEKQEMETRLQKLTDGLEAARRLVLGSTSSREKP